MTNPWKTLSSEVAYKSKWISIRHDEVIRPDGKPGTYDVLERPRSNQIIALNCRGEVCLVGQWRYPTGRYSWELPGGANDEGEDDLSTAKRELHEETGLVSKRWTYVGNFSLLNGITPALVDVWLAEEAEQTNFNEAAEEGICRVITIPVDEVRSMIHRGEIENSAAIASFYRYDLHRQYAEKTIR